MKIDLSFAELHNPLFLAGTNLQMKLQPEKRTGLKLTYDRAEKELLVEWQGQTAIVPSSNISSMTPKLQAATVPIPEPIPDQARRSAQVSTPQSHVHAGPGHGDTGQDKPRAKAIL